MPSNQRIQIQSTVNKQQTAKDGEQNKNSFILKTWRQSVICVIRRCDWYTHVSPCCYCMPVLVVQSSQARSILLDVLQSSAVAIAIHWFLQSRVARWHHYSYQAETSTATWWRFSRERAAFGRLPLSVVARNDVIGDARSLIDGAGLRGGPAAPDERANGPYPGHNTRAIDRPGATSSSSSSMHACMHARLYDSATFYSVLHYIYSQHYLHFTLIPWSSRIFSSSDQISTPHIQGGPKNQTIF